MNDIYVGHFSLYIDLESHGSQTLAHRFGLPGKTDKGSCHAELLLEQIVFSFCNRSYIVFFSLCNRSYNVFFLAVGAALYLHMGQFLQGGKNGRLMSYFF